MKKIMFIMLALSFSGAYACSLAPTTEAFIINSNLQKIIPSEPSFKVSNLSRGKKSKHSCSGLAYLNLKNSSPSSTEQGYIFEIYEGSFKKIRFKDVPLKTSKFSRDKDEYIFHFYETKNEPINFTLKITSVSKSGLKSKPQLLKIIDKGTQKSWWPSWSQKAAN